MAMQAMDLERQECAVEPFPAPHSGARDLRPGDELVVICRRNGRTVATGYVDHTCTPVIGYFSGDDETNGGEIVRLDERNAVAV